MSDKKSGLGVPLAVIGACAAFLAVILLLLSGGGEEEANPAIGFPVVLIVLAVVAVVAALVWRVVSRKRSGG